MNDKSLSGSLHSRDKNRDRKKIFANDEFVDVDLSQSVYNTLPASSISKRSVKNQSLRHLNHSGNISITTSYNNNQNLNNNNPNFNDNNQNNNNNQTINSVSCSDFITTINNKNKNDNSKNNDNKLSSISSIRSRQTKSDLATDQLIVRKITSDRDLHRRAKSNINVSALSSYNYRVDDKDEDQITTQIRHTNVEQNSDRDRNLNKDREEIDENLKLQSITNSVDKLNLNNNRETTRSIGVNSANSIVDRLMERKTKLEAEIKANLISKIGAIGLAMNDRPAGLPPKSKEELEYQQKLYSDMIKSNQRKLDSETKSIVKKTIINDNKELKLSNDSIFWHSLADSVNFESELSKNLTIRKISSGMPSYVRGKIWKLFSQHKISIAEEVFDRMFNADHQQMVDCMKSLDNEDDEFNLHESIEIDADRTLPYLKLFQKDHPMHDDLCRLLCVFHRYNSNVGYAQGMSYAMAIFLLNLQPFDSFVCFNNLINDPIFTALYTCDANKLDEIYIWFEMALSLENDKLLTHIHQICLDPYMYLLDWLMSAFCKIFSLEIVSRIFDNYFLEGSIFFFKCAIMILNYHEKQILSSNDPIYCAQLLTKPITNLPEDTIFKRIKQIDDYSYLYKQLEMFLKFN